MTRRSISWPAVAAAALVCALLISCGDDAADQAPTANPSDDAATTIEQGTVANLGPYRVGVVSVETANRSAVVSIFRGTTLPNATLVVGEPLRVAGGLIELLETKDGGSKRDTIRIRFVPE